jgi:hypothetical protein
MQIVMSMEYAADVSPAYGGMAVREHAMSAPGGNTHGDSSGRSKYGAQQQNVMVVQIDQRRNPLIGTEANQYQLS